MIFLFFGSSIAHLEPELQRFEDRSIYVVISITYQFGVHQFWRNSFYVLGHFLIWGIGVIHSPFLLQFWIIPFEFTAVDGMAHLIVLAAERLFIL